MRRRNIWLVVAMAMAIALALGAVTRGSSQSMERPREQTCGETPSFVDVGDRIVNRAYIVYITEGRATVPGGHVVRVVYRSGATGADRARPLITHDGTRAYKEVREDLLLVQ